MYIYYRAVIKKEKTNPQKSLATSSKSAEKEEVISDSDKVTSTTVEDSGESITGMVYLILVLLSKSTF